MVNVKTIYFAGSICGGRDDQHLYSDIIELLKEHGRVLTEHIGDNQLTVNGEVMSNERIHDRDLDWLMKSECLVAEVTTPSLGVGYEIGKATEWGKPVLCLFRPGNGRVLSSMIAGCSGVKLREYRTVAELKKIIDDFVKGL